MRVGGGQGVPAGMRGTVHGGEERGGIVSRIPCGRGRSAAQRQRVAEHGQGLAAEPGAAEGLGAGELALGRGEARRAGPSGLGIGGGHRGRAVDQLGLREGRGVAEGGEGVGGARREEEGGDLDGGRGLAADDAEEAAVGEADHPLQGVAEAGAEDGHVT